MFGEGEIDFPPILQALAEVGYTGGVYVELSRHSHEGPAAARRAFEFLNGNENTECEQEQKKSTCVTFSAVVFVLQSSFAP